MSDGVRERVRERENMNVNVAHAHTLPSCAHMHMHTHDVFVRARLQPCESSLILQPTVTANVWSDRGFIDVSIITNNRDRDTDRLKSVTVACTLFPEQIFTAVMTL